jgi:hypothetical protein
LLRRIQKRFDEPGRNFAKDKTIKAVQESCLANGRIALILQRHNTTYQAEVRHLTASKKIWKHPQAPAKKSKPASPAKR